jgi:hypothetical protein
MPRLDIIYRDGRKESEYKDTVYDAMESGTWRLTWDGVERVEVYDRHGDLRAWKCNWD